MKKFFSCVALVAYGGYFSFLLTVMLSGKEAGIAISREFVSSAISFQSNNADTDQNLDKGPVLHFQQHKHIVPGKVRIASLSLHYSCSLPVLQQREPIYAYSKPAVIADKAAETALYLKNRNLRI